LKLKYGKPLSNFAMKINGRRYTTAEIFAAFKRAEPEPTVEAGLTLVHFSAQLEPFLSLTE
jgi:hypothetical protein